MEALQEGKTKVVLSGDTADEVILETKDELTGGDAAKRQHIEGIAVFKTRQAANVFRLLEATQIPTAFLRLGGPRRLVCHACEMFPLELVIRRFAWGSYLKRHPEITSTQERPHRFEHLHTEYFHKHAVVLPPNVDHPRQMAEDEARRRFLVEGRWQSGVYTDPLIQIGADRWRLYSAKDPLAEAKPLLDVEPLLDEASLAAVRRDLMIPTFEALERAWSQIETVTGAVVLVDMKIEIGRRRRDDKLVVADVIDNDSWRIWPGGDPARQLDKQCFRDDHPLQQVAENYELVAALTDRFADLV